MILRILLVAASWAALAANHPQAWVVPAVAGAVSVVAAAMRARSSSGWWMWTSVAALAAGVAPLAGSLSFASAAWIVDGAACFVLVAEIVVRPRPGRIVRRQSVLAASAVAAAAVAWAPRLVLERQGTSPLEPLTVEGMFVRVILLLLLLPLVGLVGAGLLSRRPTAPHTSREGADA